MDLNELLRRHQLALIAFARPLEDDARRDLASAANELARRIGAIQQTGGAFASPLAPLCAA
jgi:hypothetical protein